MRKVPKTSSAGLRKTRMCERGCRLRGTGWREEARAAWEKMEAPAEARRMPLVTGALAGGGGDGENGVRGRKKGILLLGHSWHGKWSVLGAGDGWVQDDVGGCGRLAGLITMGSMQASTPACAVVMPAALGTH